jgi:O-antigen ligase
LLLVMAVNPIVAGIVVKKAFWYLSGTASLMVVAALRARGATLGAAAGAVVCAVLVSFAVTGDYLPSPIRGLVSSEISQQSLGGRGGRERLAMDAIQIWRGHKVFGVGPGNMWPYMHRYSTLDTSHNQFTNILLELGIVGLGLVGAFGYAAVTMGLRLTRQVAGNFERQVVTGWLGLLVGLFVGGITGDVIFPSVRNAGLATFAWAYPQWIVLGLVVSLLPAGDWRRVKGGASRG